MRIAFVGKGGSGKTTLAALFSQFLAEENVKNILSIDADINVHLPELLFGEEFPKNKFLSKSTNDIKKYLLGKNRLSNLETFRKTTPPNSNSKLINIDDSTNQIFKKFSIKKDALRVMAVGTYESDGIGASCYHNNLSILENLLTHLIDRNGILVADMMAGTDAFASSLHAQFDVIILVVESTRRSIEVFNQYIGLSKSAGVDKNLFVLGNKIFSKEDKDFLVKSIPKEKLIGFISNSNYIREHDKNGGVIKINKLEPTNHKVLSNIFKILVNNVDDPNQRLDKIKKLHKKYISQSFIKERFGDLSSQIDQNFKFS